MKKYIFFLFFIPLLFISSHTAFAAITYFGSASTPADSSSATNTVTPNVIVPPANMQEGDLVIMVGSVATTTGTLSVSQAGGQSWTALTQRNATRNRTNIFYARFNGTWTANPSINMTTAVNNIAVMHVFRPTDSAHTWGIDVAESSATYSATTTVVISGITTQTNGALVFASWSSADDNTWGSLTAGWNTPGSAQYRNTSGSYDQSITSAYMIKASAGATGNVSKTQATLGADVGTRWIIAFKEVPPIPGTPGNPTYSDTTGSATRVNWTAATNAASYKVERATHSGSCGSYSEIASGVTNLYYDDSGLSSGTTYCYRIRATNISGDGNYNTATTVTTLIIPGTPGNPTYSDTTGSATRVNWTAATNAASYKVERATHSGSCGSYSEIASGVTNLYYDDSGLSQATTYCYRIRATASGGDGSYNTPTTVTTLSLIPDATSVSYPLESDGGRSGQSITITGTNFGTVSAGSRANCSGGVGTGCVRFIAGGNATVPDVSVSTWSATSITLTIPASLASYGGASALQVVAAGNEDTTPLSFIIYPNITSLASVGANSAREHVPTDTDGLIMLVGDHLGSDGGSVHFTGAFGSVTSTIHASTGGSCTVAGWASDGTSVCGETNPAISDSIYSGTITLTRSDGKTDVWNTFTILPRITSVYPASGAPGTVVRIQGNHLCKGGTCPSQGSRATSTHSVRVGTKQIPENKFKSPGSPKSTVSTPIASFASQRLLLAFVVLKNENGEMVSSVSGGGLTWTKVTSVVNGSQVRVEAWKAYTSSPFVSTITATLSTTTRATISAVAFSNVDISNPVGVVETSLGNSSSPSISLTTTANDSLVVGILGASDSPTVVGASGTDVSQELHTIGGLETNRVTSAITKKLAPISSPSSVNMSSTLSISKSWAMIGLEIKKDL